MNFRKNEKEIKHAHLKKLINADFIVLTFESQKNNWRREKFGAHEYNK